MITGIDFLLLPLVPEDDGSGFQACGHVDQPLIGRAAEAQVQIFEACNERPVNQHVEIGQKLLRDLPRAELFCQNVAVEEIARERPDGFFGIGRLDPARKLQQPRLVLRLKRFAAEIRDAPDIAGSQQGEKNRLTRTPGPLAISQFLIAA